MVTLFIGFSYRIYLKHFKEYAIGGKNISFMTIALSFFATQIGGGSTYGTVAEIFNKGIIFALASLGYAVASFFVAYAIAPYFNNSKFKNFITVGDMIKHFYGQKSEKITALISLLFGIGVLSTQIMVLGAILQFFLELPYTTSAIIAGLTITLYSAFGGIVAVVLTDVIQFILLAVTIPLLGTIMVDKAGGIVDMIASIPSEKFLITSHPQFFEFLSLFIFFVAPFHLFQPTTIQRCLILKNPVQIRKMFNVYGIIKVILIAILTLIGLSAILIYPDINPKQIINISLAEHFPPIIKGIAISGMLAVIMSTADSHLNSSAVIATHNIFSFKSDKLKIVKLISFLIGILALLIALLDINIIKMIVFLELLYGVGIGIPLIYGLTKFKVIPMTFYIIFGSAVVLMFYFYIWRTEVNYYIPTIIIAVILSIMSFHFLLIKKMRQRIN